MPVVKNKRIICKRLSKYKYQANILKLVLSIRVIVLSMFFTINSIAQNKITTPKSGRTFRDCKDCPEMVVLSAGSFLMGSPENEPGRFPEESPQRKVSIRQFAAGRYDITKKEWALFVNATNRPTVSGCSWAALPGDTVKLWEASPSASWNHIGFRQDSSHPAVCISWEDAQDYVNWLSKKTSFSYRLLTEAEWEYATRAGTTTVYSWGDTASHEYANYGADSCCSSLASGSDKWVFGTSPVGAFPPNKFGLYDMNGNVMQWVEDCFNYPYSDKPTDGSAYKDAVQLSITGEFSSMSGTNSCSYHILRGGDFNDPPRFIRSAFRNFAPSPGVPINQPYRNAAVGFRIARTL
jgi:formylglycine-generating enzyme required for sulfatase activity